MFDLIGIIIKGGPVMVPLLACSIISLAVVIERIIFWRKARSREPAGRAAATGGAAGVCQSHRAGPNTSICPPHGS